MRANPSISLSLEVLESDSDTEENVVAKKPRNFLSSQSMSLDSPADSCPTFLVPQTARSPPFSPVLRLQPRLSATQVCTQKCETIHSYAVNTHQGIVRNYNEDRVSIFMNLQQPFHRQGEQWPVCCYFGLFDGHGGSACSNFLRDSLHEYLVSEPKFPHNPSAALLRAFEKADKDFLQNAILNNEKSGSCASVMLIIGGKCYTANTGDSRIIMSCRTGKKALRITNDHKVSDRSERRRVEKAGGRVYFSGVRTAQDGLLGCYRVSPGGLAVSRSFGDADAKLLEKGGNPWVVIATPEIKTIHLDKEHDFIVMASDGVYDCMEDIDVVNTVWNIARNRFLNLGKLSELAVEDIMNECFSRLSTDNVTVILVALAGLQKELKKLRVLFCGK